MSARERQGPPDAANTDGSERRREDRGPLMLRVDYGDGGAFVSDYTENLSRGGVFVATARRFQIGDKVELILSFPGLLAPQRLTGEVRWLREHGDATGEAGVGVQFTPAPDGLARLAFLVDRVRAGDRAVVAEVRHYRLLLVEDNEHVRFLVREGLRAVSERQRQSQVAFDIDEAGNGAQALSLLRRKTYDAVVTDLYLPELDGVSLIRRMREDPALAGVPILVVSAGGDAALQGALEAGADLALAKPLQVRSFFETVTKLLALRAQG